MRDSPGDASGRWQPYEDLFSYEDEGEAPAGATPPAKTQAAPRLAALKSAGKRSRPGKTPPKDTTSSFVQYKV